MDKWERQHRRNLAIIERQIRAIYEAAAMEAAAIGATVGELSEEMFTFDRFPLTHARMNQLMADMNSRINATVENGVNSSWTLANTKNDMLASTVLGAVAAKLTRKKNRQYFAHNEAARDAFVMRMVNGMTLSMRVWKYTEQFKRELEMALDVGIRDGKSADEIARDIRSYMKHPDKLFRRVRDEHGMLKLSQAAKQFHPGQGVYRSSYMNARRLAATETNMAYRSADFERYQRMDFIVGIEVHLSQNHTCKGVKGPFIDICDELKGEYPKDFKFTGWHPHCRCFTTTILKTEKEMAEDEKRIMRGLDPLEGSENQVTDVPDGFKQWVERNQERIGRASKRGTMPYFLKDNGAMDAKGVYALKEFKQYRGTPRPTAVSISEAQTSRTMPEGLTAAQQKAWINNEREVARRLGVEQGEPMTFEQADELKGNPHYVAGSGSGYTINCASSVFANELRRRGYDVEAMMNTRKATDTAYLLSRRTEVAWIDPLTGMMPVPTEVSVAPFATGKGDWGVFQSIERSYRDQLAAKGTKFDSFLGVNIPEEAVYLPNGRYHLRIKWEGDFGIDSGHIVAFEKTGPGKYRFIDAQTGSTDSLVRLASGGAYRKKAVAQLYRVDTLMPNPDFLGAVAKAGTTKASRVKYARKKGGWSGVMGSSPLDLKARARRSELRELAKPLTEIPLTNPSFGMPVKLTNTNVKEWLNQPFIHYEEKNELILEIHKVFREAKYKGWGKNYKNPKLKVHVFEITIKGDSAWIIVKESESGEHFLYSISDKASILDGIISKPR